jgi:hypothetical protein
MRIQPHHISLDLVRELTLLTRDSTPVKHLFLRNKRLISYAQTFERKYLLKSMMMSSQGKALSRLRLVRDTPSNQYTYFTNPYRATHYHPVENALHHVSAAVEIDALSDFLEARKTVLEYLEAQYRRISDLHCKWLNTSKCIRLPEDFSPFAIYLKFGTAGQRVAEDLMDLLHVYTSQG